MAYYAFLDENNTVTEVIVGVDENETLEGKTPEEWYSEFRNQTCKRTSYNTQANVHINGGVPFRKNFASIGYTYDFNRDAFIAPKPYPSWVLNEDTCIWEAPVPKPDEGWDLDWNEEVQNWIEVQSL